MVEKKRKLTDVELLQAIEKMEMDDALAETKAMSDEEIAADIRANGGDPDAIGRRGKELAERLLAKMPAEREQTAAREKRLSWQNEARLRLHEAWSKAAAVPKAPTMSRDEMLRRIGAAQKDARFATQLTAAFRNRTPEASTDEELATLLDAIAKLLAIADREGGSGEGGSGEGGA